MRHLAGWPLPSPLSAPPLPAAAAPAAAAPGTPGGSDGDASRVADDSRASLDVAARLLGVGPAQLALELTSRVRVVRGQAMRSPHGPAKASDARHALAKALYGRMFDWLVEVRGCGLLGVGVGGVGG